MRDFYRALLLNLVLLPGVALGQAARTPVMVELFTSEGCSSCPPADRLLADLNSSQPIPGAEIIALEEHVDYWDGQGWCDRFSSPIFTARQNLYRSHLGFDSPYTPQMIVDGETQFVGNDSVRAFAAISKAAAKNKPTLKLALPIIEGRSLSSAVTAISAVSPPNGDLYAALVQPAASTEVRSGENGGRRLNHVSVVRVLQHVGDLKSLNKTPIAFKLIAPQDTDPASLRVVVFAQADNHGSIRAIAMASPRR